MAKATETKTLPAGWKESNGRLVATYKFKDFPGAMGFLTEVALRAEVAEHHPDFTVHWNEVRFEVWSHDVDAITDRDYGLVDQIAKAAERHSAKKP